jgi:hypothetical protein
MAYCLPSNWCTSNIAGVVALCDTLVLGCHRAHARHVGEASAHGTRRGGTPLRELLLQRGLVDGFQHIHACIGQCRSATTTWQTHHGGSSLLAWYRLTLSR